MNKLFKTDAIKRLTKRTKTKRGATLIEMIATVAILSIVASLSFEAMYMAAEEYRRVSTIAECERSISLLQENLNMYVKNAVDIRLIDKSTDASATKATTIDSYIGERNATVSDKLEDAENQDDEKYIDLMLYRSGPFEYTLAKYKHVTGQPLEWEPIITVGNIKELNFSISKLTSSYDTSTSTEYSYLFDYAVMSPTGFEMIYSKNDQVDEAVAQAGYSNNEGLYSVMTGTVINNMKTWSGAYQLRMSENVTSSADTFKGDCNFVIIRTVPREAK